MASKIRKFLDIQGLLKLIRLVKNNEQPHWIGTQAEYDSQKANIPNGAIVALTDEEDTTYDHGKYSTVETVTGQRWIDGKPIYRKVIPWKLAAADNVYTDTGIRRGVIDNLCKIYTTIKNNISSAANPYWFGSDWAGGGASSAVQTVNAYVSEQLNQPSTTNVNLYGQRYGSWPAGCQCFTVIEYTKKSD